MHFCAVVARVYSRRSLPRNTSLNWFIPALVKSSVGSSCGTSGELGTIRWPFRSKYLRNERRISLAVMLNRSLFEDRGGRPSPKHCRHGGGIESLRDQVPVRPPHRGRLVERQTALEPAIEDLLPQHRFDDILEHFV